MKTQIITAAVLAAVSLSACASAPEDIQPQFVPATAYQGKTCDQLNGDIQRIASDVDRVTGQQTAKRRSDQAAVGVGVILFAPAALLLLTKDHKRELAKLKGEFDAVRRQAEAQQCKI